MRLLQLFLAFLQIGALSFGGGYGAMPLIQAQVIDRYGWMTLSDFADLVTIAEMTPGPIAVNAATFVGNCVAGVPGALIATAGCILPACFFVTALAWLYNRYHQLPLLQGVLTHLRPAVVAMICTAGVTIFLTVIFPEGVGWAGGKGFNIRGALYFTAALVLLRKKKLRPIQAMLLCGVGEVVFQTLI